MPGGAAGLGAAAEAQAVAGEGAPASVLLGRFWREHIVRYWRWLVLAVGLMAIEAGAVGTFAYMLQPLFDDLFAAGSMEGVAWVGFAMAGLFLLRAAAGFTRQLVIVGVGLRVTTALQSRLVRHLLGLDLAYFTTHAPGSLLERVRGDTLALQALASSSVMSLGRDSMTLVALLSVMLYTDWLWTLVALVGLPLVVVPVTLLQRYIRGTTKASREAAGRLTAQLDEMFHGIQSIKLNRLETYETARFDGEVRQFLRQALRSQAGQAANPALIDVIAALGFAAVLYYGGLQIIAGDKTVGEFMSFFTALGMLFDPLRRLSNLAGQVQAGIASLDRLYAVFEAAPEILPPARPKPLRPGAISFEDVRFGYGDTAVLRGLSFTAEAGQTTALVGPSGAGKSTVLGLLTRLIDPESGTVRLGGTPVDQLDLAALRDAIAVVSQDSALFDDTIARNIRLGRLDAEEDAVREAARNASVTAFTDPLPDGLETRAGPRGAALSGGQRQRVTIARAMLKSAPILLLDEPTSALDARSEQLVQDALARLAKGRTTLVIAHRLATIRNADKILVLDKGRIVEQGTHQSLSANNGPYRTLLNMQQNTQDTPNT